MLKPRSSDRVKPNPQTRVGKLLTIALPAILTVAGCAHEQATNVLDASSKVEDVPASASHFEGCAVEAGYTGFRTIWSAVMSCPDGSRYPVEAYCSTDEKTWEMACPEGRRSSDSDCKGGSKRPFQSGEDPCPYPITDTLTVEFLR